MSDIEKQIGARVTEIRLSRKLTQAQLAEKAHLSVETISRMERGVSFPSLKTLENIACSLDTHLKNFFDFGKDQPRDQAFEREIAKLSAFLRTLETKEIILVREILKVVFRKLKRVELNKSNPDKTGTAKVARKAAPVRFSGPTG